MTLHARKRLPVLEAARESVRGARHREAIRPELAAAVVVVLDHGSRAYATERAGSGDLRLLAQLLLVLTTALPPGEDRGAPRS
ncbi:hypothetical protein MKL09_12125 [Methylobacterium sp. J-048]|jgi:hypothetical protein|uniref:hypothetical protein n=1 Tax=Methylobacterium sp. J-048 TaxID=2836635 RepID=UPI001FBAAF1D|nr:hypothetical protein [Methylobacterium sp. J-048]MCJ2057301.1 hypothetical protein [Methylobacterium sp. J-048]